MEPDRTCPQCGRKIPWGQNACPFCPGRWQGYFWTLRRDSFLLLICASLVLLFVITSFIVRINHDVEKGFAVQWYARGEDDLRAGRAEEALADFRTALSYSSAYSSGDNEQYELRLAEALTAAGNSLGSRAEARTYLLALLDRQPGNATVNLELARLAARDHSIGDAVRYYHQAIYGEWDLNSVVRRRNARLELADYLLNEGQTDAARAELIALAADLPTDPAVQTRVGMLLLRVGSYDDALKLFGVALRLDPNAAHALAGAGECYFHQGNYEQAERYLSKAVQQDPTLTHAGALSETAHDVMYLNPFNRRLGNVERGRRAAEDFNAALRRLQACSAARGIDLTSEGNDPLQTLFRQTQDLQPHVGQPSLGRDTDLLSRVMDAVFAMEQTSAKACGEPQGRDLALLLIAREQASELAGEQGGAHP